MSYPLCWKTLAAISCVMWSSRACARSGSLITAPTSRLCGERLAGEVGRADERAAAVDHEQLRVQHGVAVAVLRGPAPPGDAGHVRERACADRCRRRRCLRLGLEHDVDLAAPRDSGFEVGGDLGKGVGGVADEQDSLAGAGEQLVEDGGGQALLADRARAGPDGRARRACGLAAGGQPGAKRERDAGAGQAGAERPGRLQRSDRVDGAGRCAGGDLAESVRRAQRAARLASRAPRPGRR